MIERVETVWGGRRLVIETGRVAKQADGAVTVRYGDTVVLVTVVATREPREGVDFLPLYVDYREKTYAAGKIPGGFFKREGRPNEKEILTARLIDRPIRTLFPDNVRNEIQIMAIVLSADQENDPDVLAVIGGASALALSELPYPYTIGAVRVGLVDGEYIINPTHLQAEKSECDLVVAGTRDTILMVEGRASEVPEKAIQDALSFGHESLQVVIDVIEELVEKAGKEKRQLVMVETDPALVQAVRAYAEEKILQVATITDKQGREEFMEARAIETIAYLSADFPDRESEIRNALRDIEKEKVRRSIVERGQRVDGRIPTETRQITCEVGMLPRTHGSAIFTRGQTQSLVVTTLGTAHDEQILDELKGESSKAFMVHYNFPPFSVGEVKQIRGPGRREVGHGALAERALREVLPLDGEFPYTIRIVSDILESNGSSSMATVCGGSLSLMDAGVPIKAPVAGIALGLINENGREVILTDIAGLEDHFGDMDFKIAGTEKGITAIQMDLKIGGISSETMEKVLQQAREARLEVLDKMGSVIAKPRETISTYAPRIVTIKVNPDRIRDIIGPSGRVIKKIIEKTGVEMNIEDDGKVTISSVDESKVQEAIEIVGSLTEEVEVGKIYPGKVKRTTTFGAFVEVLPGQEGLVHISQLAEHHVRRVEDELKVGDEIMVKVINIDSLGRINLSRKEAQQDSQN